MRAPIRVIRRATIALALSCTSLSTLAAQAPGFDRRVQPPPGASPALQIPPWTTMRLANGAELIVSERRGLPLVAVTINFVGGASQLEPAGKTGLAGFVASMLSEGTTSRSGDQLSNELQLLGTSINVGIGSESGAVSFLSMADKLPATLDIMADMMLNPAFPQASLERLRANTLVQLTQARDRTSAIAGVVFPRVLYGDAHPYGRSRSEQTVQSITRDDLVAFHRAYFQPGRAVITVVGEITPTEARAQVERALAGWPAGGSRPDFAYPAVQAPGATTIYLVDKPGAAQSSFSIGLPGPPRSTPDYYALRVMNTMLGELFQSRLNANIREDKGFSYGVGASFAYGRGPGPWRAGGDVRTDATDSALVEFMREIRGIRGERAVTDDEMDAARAALIQSLPARLASVSGVGGLIGELYVQGLPQDYYQRFAQAVTAVRAEDVVRVARQYVNPERLAIVIVGDRAVIEEPLRRTGIAPIVVLDMEGRPVARP
jgi:zinc protease